MVTTLMYVTLMIPCYVRMSLTAVKQLVAAELLSLFLG